MTSSLSMKVICLICFITAALATYAATPGSGSVGILYIVYLCSLSESNGFFTFLAVIIFFLPVIVIVIMYTLIFFVAHRRHNILRNGELTQSSNYRKEKTVFQQDAKVIRMLLVIVGVFIICWTPLFIVNLKDQYDGPECLLSGEYSLDILNIVIMKLPLFNSIFNPIIYAWLDQKYREAFRHLFQKTFGRPNSKTVTKKLNRAKKNEKLPESMV